MRASSSHMSLPRFPPPPNMSLPWPEFEISNSSAKLILRFCPAAREMEAVDRAFSRVAWLLCLIFVRVFLGTVMGVLEECEVTG
jgi:hypothetical protein